jgi:acetylornithine deacetylase
MGWIEERQGELVELAVELVRAPSLLGQEEAAQQIVASYLETAGFQVRRVEVDAIAALADEQAGYPPLDYTGRTSVVATHAGGGGGRSLHLSGHIDVVPVDEPEGWQHPPWAGDVSAGKLWGRGSGDMKGGLAAYLLAARAVAEVCDDLRGDLLVSSVIEEECGGNGMWSVLRSGHVADATLIGEPTGLTLGHAGTGVVWPRLTAAGTADHAAHAGREGPFDHLAAAVAALRSLEAELNRNAHDSIFATASAWPYGLTIGRIEGGVWTSSVPSALVVRARCGFGLDHSPAEIQHEIRVRVAAAAPSVRVDFDAFRAQAYCHDATGPFPETLRAAHRDALGAESRTSVFTATTDARLVEGPCLCYGPTAGAYHGRDEWVELDSLAKTAAVVALAAQRWLA